MYLQAHREANWEYEQNWPKKINNNNCKQWDGINVIYEIYPPKVADALGLQNFSAYAFENTKITVKIYLRSNISPSCRCRSHWSICLFVNVISLEKMLPQHNTMFVVVSASVWGKIAWTIGVGTGYSWFCLSFFVPLLSCVTHSSCSLHVCLCLLEKRRKLRLFCGAQVFFRLFFTPPLKRDSHFTVASRLPPFDRKTPKNCALQIQAFSMKLIVVFFLYTKVFHFDKKKRGKGPWDQIPFFFNDSDIF